MKTDFKRGDIIIFCDQEFEVIKNYGESGLVRENCKNGCYIDDFRWKYGNDICELKNER